MLRLTIMPLLSAHDVECNTSLWRIKISSSRDLRLPCAARHLMSDRVHHQPYFLCRALARPLCLDHATRAASDYLSVSLFPRGVEWLNVIGSAPCLSYAGMFPTAVPDSDVRCRGAGSIGLESTANLPALSKATGQGWLGRGNPADDESDAAETTQALLRRSPPVLHVHWIGNG